MLFRSTNTFYNPAHFSDRKVPTTLIARNLMLAHQWGIKTFYYSLINKQGAKQREDESVNNFIESAAAEVFDDIEDCEACKL